VSVHTISDYRLRGGEPERVTVVTPDSVDDFLNTDERSRADHLRALRDLGILRHQPGRLTGKVRVRPAVAGDSGLIRAYVFAGDPEDVPRKKRRRSGRRVYTW
jgi:hypothetical protein